MRPARPGTRLPSARPDSPLKPPSAGLGPPFTSGGWERPPLRRPRLSEEGDSGKGALRRRPAVLARGRTWAGQAVPTPSGWFLLRVTSKEGLPASPLRGGQKFSGPVGDLAAGPQAVRHGRLAPLERPFERPKPVDPGATSLPCPAGARPEPFAYRNRLPGQPCPGSGPPGDQRPRLHPHSRSLGRSRSAVGGRA